MQTRIRLQTKESLTILPSAQCQSETAELLTPDTKVRASENPPNCKPPTQSEEVVPSRGAGVWLQDKVPEPRTPGDAPAASRVTAQS